jgi:hypothetical protein
MVHHLPVTHPPLLTGCSKSQIEATASIVTIQLTEIVDKSTHQPITENTITLRWGTSDGEVVDEQDFGDQSSILTTLAADGDELLWV